MQHYGLANVWQSGDFITRAILGILFIMSILSWTVIVVKLWHVLRIKRVTGRTDAQFCAGRQLRTWAQEPGRPCGPR